MPTNEKSEDETRAVVMEASVVVDTETSLDTDPLFKKNRRGIRPVGLRARSFFESNDLFSLPEILLTAVESPPSKKDENLDKENFEIADGKTNNVVTLLVGKSDVFSIVDKVEGDIIVCDLDENLLNFINEEREKLLPLYEELEKGAITFLEVVEKYNGWIRKKHPDSLSQIHARRFLLGNLHFLSSQEKFISAMSALKKKKILTLCTDLLDRGQQDELVSLIKKYKKKVRLFNLTNLPDYDRNNCLINLINQLPWVDHYQIVWSTIDPLTSDSKDICQFLFIADNKTQYITYSDMQAELWGKIDHLIFEETHESLSFGRYPSSYLNGDSKNSTKKREKYTKAFTECKATTLEEICKEYAISWGLRYPPRGQPVHLYRKISDEIINIYHVREIQLKLKKIKETNINKKLRKQLLNELNQLTPSIREEKCQVFRLRIKRAFFLVELLEAVNIAQQKIYSQYPGPVDGDIHQASDSLLENCLENMSQFDFSSNENPKQYLKKFVLNNLILKHRWFNSEKHYFCTAILNILMFIPIFGLIKYAVTGSYFFNKKTYRENLISSEFENIVIEPRVYNIP